MNAVRSYHQLAGLENLYLEDSYVLGLRELESSIEFDILAVLTKAHPLYSPPGELEQHCYRRACLVFRNAYSVEWVTHSFAPIKDGAGEIDYGNIDTFTEDNGAYFLSGEWGKVAIRADPPLIEYR
jgi:hypothetical protein